MSTELILENYKKTIRQKYSNECAELGDLIIKSSLLKEEIKKLEKELIDLDIKEKVLIEKLKTDRKAL